jgi:hypothetical protein
MIEQHENRVSFLARQDGIYLLFLWGLDCFWHLLCLLNVLNLFGSSSSKSAEEQTQRSHVVAEP